MTLRELHARLSTLIESGKEDPSFDRHLDLPCEVVVQISPRKFVRAKVVNLSAACHVYHNANGGREQVTEINAALPQTYHGVA